MSLIIDNYKFGQTINFSLPLIEGRAPDLCCRIHSIHSKCESDCTSWVICMHNDGQSSRSFIISGRFQLLISLKRGRNQMQFQYSKCAQSVVPFEICFEPIESQFRVQLVYITCPSKDDAAELFEKGRFQSPPHIRSDAEAATIKLGLAARMLQTFFAQSRCRHHFARNTFSLKSDHNGQPLVEIIKLNEPIDRLYSLCEQDLWTLVAKHLIQSTNDRKVKYLGICSFSRYSSDSNLNEDQLNQLDYEELIGRVRGFVCMGGGQLALMGSCSLFTWPSHFNQVSKRFNDSTPIDRRKWFDDSGSNSSTIGGVYANTLGSAAHELGHTLDLGHARSGIMGRSFEQIDSFFDLRSRLIAEDRIGRRRLNRQWWWHRPALAVLSFHEYMVPKESKQSAIDFWNRSSNFDSFVEFKDHSTSHFRFDEKKYVIWSRFGVRMLDFRDEHSLTICFHYFNEPSEFVRLDDFISYKSNSELSISSNDAAVILIMDWTGNCFRMEN